MYMYPQKFPLILFTTCIIIVSVAKFCHSQQERNFNSPENGQVIQIVGAFTRSSSAAAEAVRLAVKDINTHNSIINFHLRINLSESGETQCHPEQAVELVRRLMSTWNGHVIGSTISRPVILAGCEDDCRAIAGSDVASQYNAITLCYGLTNAPMISHLEQEQEDDESFSILNFPKTMFHTGLSPVSNLLYTLKPELVAVVYPLVKFVHHFAWRKVAVLYHSESLTDGNHAVLAQLADHLSSVLSQHGVDVGRVEEHGTFSTNAMKIIESQDFRIIFVIGSEISLQQVLCHIYQRKLYNVDKYVWFFVGPNGREWVEKSHYVPFGVKFSPENVHEQDCTAEQLIEAVNGHFMAHTVSWNPNDNMPTVSNKGTNAFRREMHGILQKSGEHIQPDFDEAPLAYDAVWAAYIALSTSLYNCQTQGVGVAPCGMDFDDSFNGVWFPGVSGNVSFHQGMRSVTTTTIRIERFRNKGMQPIAWHFNENNSFSWILPSPFGHKIPEDGIRSGEIPSPDFPPVVPEIPDFFPDNFPTQPSPPKNSAALHFPHLVWLVLVVLR